VAFGIHRHGSVRTGAVLRVVGLSYEPDEGNAEFHLQPDVRVVGGLRMALIPRASVQAFRMQANHWTAQGPAKTVAEMRWKSRPHPSEDCWTSR
jgi:hypothetical protein